MKTKILNKNIVTWVTQEEISRVGESIWKAYPEFTVNSREFVIAEFKKANYFYVNQKLGKVVKIV